MQSRWIRFLEGVARRARLLALVVALGEAEGAAADLPGPEKIANGGFEQGFEGWTRWGNNAALITLDRQQAHGGAAAARISHGHNALYVTSEFAPGEAYELCFYYRLEGRGAAGQLSLGYLRAGGTLNSAGREVVRLSGTDRAAVADWREYRRVFLPPVRAASVQVAFSAGAGSVLWVDDLSLRAVARPPGIEAPPDPWAGLERRTERPLFRELLGDQAGGYTVTSWTHDLIPKGSGGGETGETAALLPEPELGAVLAETGSSRLGFMNLPGWLDRRTPLRTAEFHREQFARYGVRYDVWTEGGASIAAGIKQGAEVLNPSARALGRRPSVSWVDPAYVAAQERALRELGRQLRGEPFVGVYYGKDEPILHLPEGPQERWGGYGRRMAREVMQGFGGGRWRAPEPQEREFLEDPARALRWLAYNRWANEQFIQTRTRLGAALREGDPGARYSPANYWFMSGFVPYDYARLGAISDLVDLDPYASSAERSRGRGVYNHGFGAKFMADLTEKPVRIVAQAFDYAGYAMTPDDLREWVSQALRCGASAITYYTLDRPRTTRPERWRMMLHLARTVGEMPRLQLPARPDTAVLYTVYTHMSQGADTTGDQLYAAHVLLGERAGSWFKFVSDTQLERGERTLADYKVVYLPLARYITAATSRGLEEYVRAGGVLVCGDFGAFAADPSGTDTTAVRERLLGVRGTGRKEAREMIWGATGRKLPLFEMKLWEVSAPGLSAAMEVLDPAATVLATYPDGAPAAVERTLGRGCVITFAANPFAPQVAVEASDWPEVFRKLQQARGCAVDLPIWRFLLPAPPEAPAVSP